MPTILMAFSLPLVVINFSSPIVAIIWLVYLGEYLLLLISLIAVLLSTFMYALAMIPALAVLIPGIFLLEKKNALLRGVGLAISSIGGMWSYALMAGWTIYVFSYLPEIIIDKSLPHILLAYCVSTAPFSYMASKETNENWSAHFATLTNQMSSAALTLMIIFADLEMSEMIPIFLGIIIIFYTIGLLSGLLEQLTKPRHSKE